MQGGLYHDQYCPIYPKKVIAGMDRPLRYHVYLLTMWEEPEQVDVAQVVWRFRLEDPSTGKQFGLTNLEALVAVLENVTNSFQPDGGTK
jgi:hypothetical protein